MPERRSSAKTSDRLGRMLVIVPYLVRHPGAELSEVSRLFDVTQDELRRDLDLLFMSGLPPYGPGDLIDVDVDEDGRVWITMADHFSRPLRLTRSEALALYLRGTELASTAGLPEAPALASSLQKLREGLGPETLGAAAIESAAGASPPPHLAALRTAAQEHRRVRIEYFAGSTGQWSTRQVEVEAVFSSIGNWYAVAWDVDADGERLFRVDRIRSVEETGQTFTPRGLEGAGRPLYTLTEHDVAVRLRLGPGARWLAEYYATTDEREREDGTIEVTLPARQLGWVATLLLGVGPEAQIVDPPELRERLHDMADRTLRRYRE